MMFPLMYDPITAAGIELDGLAQTKGYRTYWHYHGVGFSVGLPGATHPWPRFSTATAAKEYIDLLPIAA